LRPEFIARVDEVIVFRSLTQENYQSIAKLMLDEYVEPLMEKGIKFTYDDSVCEYVARKSANGNSGARDIRNFIRKELEDKITTELIKAKDEMISGIYATAENDEIKLQII
jgi:ATP-dependent Clp protease ATP-binding subunit ClpA